MANETELANIGHATDEVSDGISAALVNNVVLMPLIYSEDLPADSNVKLFRKAGSLAAAAVAESSGVAPVEYTETEITATAAKHAAVSRLTVEAQTFSRITNEALIAEQGRGIARDIEDEIYDLFGAFATSVDAGVSMDTDTIMDCVFNVFNANAGMGSTLIAALDYSQVNDLRKQLLTSGAAVFSQPQQSTLLQGAMGNANGFAGSLPGVDVYQITAFTDSGNDEGLVFNPANAFASMMSPGVQTRVRWVGDDDGSGTAGFYDELASWMFYDVVEWNDLAGCQALSDS